ncbi:hypothetical protein DPX16_5729 [Anabarilius grahami]|uniref:Uncharacterized protein n=1 Tax=Anabarilius grahami TaxID=495550 RepID=A0A3N0Z9V0_ANAGA|nr:hypothetical protein DPX16_5729 [Anabarilius grahami]
MGDPPNELPNEVSDQNLRCRIWICLVPAQIKPWILQTFDVLAMGLFLQAWMPFLGLFQDTGEEGFVVVGTVRVTSRLWIRPRAERIVVQCGRSTSDVSTSSWNSEASTDRVALKPAARYALKPAPPEPEDKMAAPPEPEDKMAAPPEPESAPDSAPPEPESAPDSAPPEPESAPDSAPEPAPAHHEPDSYPPWQSHSPDPPWRPKAPVLPGPPDSPDPPWRHKAPVLPWPPDSPDPPWRPEPPWPPEAPDPPWRPEAPDPRLESLDLPWRPPYPSASRSPRQPPPLPGGAIHGVRVHLPEGGHYVTVPVIPGLQFP